jgi:hypothetical protein
MSSSAEFRLYSFVAGLYLSPLQRGLQTAHIVSELAAQAMDGLAGQIHAFSEWASKDKTIIICEASNYKGILDCWAELKRTGIDTGLVMGAIFRENEESMNCMATACGVLVPRKYWDVEWVADEFAYGGGYWRHSKVDQPLSPSDYDCYWLTHAEGQFISHIKKYRLTSS